MGKKTDTGRVQQCWWKTTGGSVLSQFNGCIPRPIRSHPPQFEASTSHRIISIFHNCKEVLNFEINVLSVSTPRGRRSTFRPPGGNVTRRHAAASGCQNIGCCAENRREGCWTGWVRRRGQKPRTHTKDTLAPGRRAAPRWIQTGSKVRRLLSPRITTEEDEKLLAVGWF